MWQRFSRPARRAVFNGMEEARRRGQEQLDTEHLLLGLLREPEGRALQALLRIGVTPEQVVETVEQLAAAEEPAGAAPPGDAGQMVTPGVGAVMLIARAIATEHVHRHTWTDDLLLGLIQEKDGLAARALASLAVDEEAVSRACRDLPAEETPPAPRREEPGPPATAQERRSGYERGSEQARDRGAERMWQRFTERARRVVFFAQEEAARLGENYVGTEHLLLGLVRESDSVAARILDRLGVSLSRIRADVERQVTRGHGNLGQDMQLTPRAKRVIDLAYEEARRLNNNYIGTEHILLGLVREGDGLAARVLIKLGADLERTRARVDEMQEGDPQAQAAYQAFQEGLGGWLSRIRGRRVGEPPEEAAAGVQPPEEAADSPLDGLRWLVGQREHYGARDYAREAASAAVEFAREACDGVTDLLSVSDLTAEQAWALLLLAAVLKETRAADPDSHAGILSGKALAMIFEKPSLRTRVSFETGMFQLGGHALYLQPADIAMGTRETVPDTARVLERMADGIMARVFRHETVRELAEHAGVPVINGLCDREHPCQALSDLLTLWEKRGEIAGRKIAYVGDGNNVAHSLLLLGAKLGARVYLACPEGYQPDPEIVREAVEAARAADGFVAVVSDPRQACTDADVIYTDVWTSMGQEAEAEARRQVFAPYQVNEELCALAKPDFLFMHCLPAHRGEEVTAAVADGPNSVIFDQAENRLHAQKAVLAVLLA
jgi:ornithine carbamoyltransferase